jgi:hypothetical protein
MADPANEKKAIRDALPEWRDDTFRRSLSVDADQFYLRSATGKAAIGFGETERVS